MPQPSYYSLWLTQDVKRNNNNNNNNNTGFGDGVQEGSARVKVRQSNRHFPGLQSSFCCTWLPSVWYGAKQNQHVAGIWSTKHYDWLAVWPAFQFLPLEFHILYSRFGWLVVDQAFHVVLAGGQLTRESSGGHYPHDFSQLIRETHCTPYTKPSGFWCSHWLLRKEARDSRASYLCFMFTPCWKWSQLAHVQGNTDVCVYNCGLPTLFNGYAQWIQLSKSCLFSTPQFLWPCLFPQDVGCALI